MKAIRLLILPVILLIYTFTFMATKPAGVCDDDCERVGAFSSQLYQGRESYVLASYRCSFNRISDTLCITVRDTTGIDWNVLADTACAIATRNGLLHQQIYIFRTATTPLDTLAKKRCP